ncbi:uncharacterized protein K460DRAFT_269746 [Cucurbitaria berberidis CBS 394.84]|uniref:Protein kinase domain-containing protein n=1 Tax=Cucurbitaria berberidis CBS 394.84 TaxID=1168544 RepID=A0A9P4LBI1_9PLEO|nr:uncharacterized protein K460DRAFT_269746 [Cucurbitaria berberidis CBS 394.84]KAF1849621.1 hypothetical protein K460DRAFT_269746 [Cucurbitaria berberidis CBS 394.84]
MRVDPCIGANIRSKKDLTSLCEVENIETGAFIRSTFTYIDDHDKAWFGQTKDIRKYDLTVQDLNRLLQRVPDERIYPLKTTTLSGEAKLLPQLLLQEAEVLQFLEQNPHPNIIRFHGCTVNRGRFTGIALDKHSVILQYRHEDVPHPLNIDACMRVIRAAVKHLHSFRLAHNDLNPTNIAIDGDDNPILLDFGSCRRFGERLLSGGTFSWIDEDYSTSAQCHDELAMVKIEAWLLSEAQEKH